MAAKIENPVETLIGAAVLAAAIGFGVYASNSDDAAAATGSYQVTAQFRNASGVNTGSDVRIAGVKVGRVVDMRLNPTTYRAVVVMSVDQSIELTDESWATIDTEGLLGGTYIELDPGAGLEILANGDTITNTQGAVSLLDLLAAFAGSDSGGQTK